MLFCRSPYVDGYLRLPMSLTGGMVTLRALVGYGVRYVVIFLDQRIFLVGEAHIKNIV